MFGTEQKMKNKKDNLDNGLLIHGQNRQLTSNHLQNI